MTVSLQQSLLLAFIQPCCVFAICAKKKKSFSPLNMNRKKHPRHGTSEALHNSLVTPSCQPSGFLESKMQIANAVYFPQPVAVIPSVKSIQWNSYYTEVLLMSCALYMRFFFFFFIQDLLKMCKREGDAAYCGIKMHVLHLFFNDQVTLFHSSL